MADLVEVEVLAEEEAVEGGDGEGADRLVDVVREEKVGGELLMKEEVRVGVVGMVILAMGQTAVDQEGDVHREGIGASGVMMIQIIDVETEAWLWNPP